VRIDEVSEIARRWVAKEGPRIPGFRGAVLHGSVAWASRDEEVAPDSDVDVLVIVDGQPAAKPGKLIYGGVLLEISLLPAGEITDPERVLCQAHLGGSFRGTGILADPTGELARLMAVVGAEFARTKWVRARCRNVEAKLLGHLDRLGTDAPLPQMAQSWLFGTGLTTHVLLTAGLRNPTVRKRYSAVRDLLSDYGRLEDYERLLRQLGCAYVTADQVAGYLPGLEAAFEAAAGAIRSPFPWAADLTPDARRVAIDGSRRLIETGEHREAVFWIAVTYARSMQVLEMDAPPVAGTHEPGFRALLADLGVSEPSGQRRRAGEVRASLVWLQDVAKRLMQGNAAIRD
jgi:hypothetical protein